MNNDTKSERIFKIPSTNLAKFQERWEKLVRRAIKLGVTPPTYSIFKEEPVAYAVTRERFNELKGIMEHYQDEVVVLVHHVSIQHPVVKVAGWEFVASIEHTEEGNVIHNISGEDLPAKYRASDAYCDHCKTRRNRKGTFVLKREETDSSCDDKFSQYEK